MHHIPLIETLTIQNNCPQILLKLQWKAGPLGDGGAVVGLRSGDLGGPQPEVDGALAARRDLRAPFVALVRRHPPVLARIPLRPHIVIICFGLCIFCFMKDLEAGFPLQPGYSQQSTMRMMPFDNAQQEWCQEPSRRDNLGRSGQPAAGSVFDVGDELVEGRLPQLLPALRVLLRREVCVRLLPLRQRLSLTAGRFLYGLA